MNGSERTETIIIGGGQAGLALGYHLSRLGRSFLILDANERVGDAWRNRWDSLRLFTPAKYNGLDGMRFPASGVSFPTKDEMADYLEAYAERFELPVRGGARVRELRRENGRYVIDAEGRRYQADNVVVATGSYHIPKSPPFARELDPSIRQIHSRDYKNPNQLHDGAVLVVGIGNSGAEIAYEVSRSHPTAISGSPSAQIPVKHGPRAARFFIPLIRFMGTHVLTQRTPIGRKVKPVFVKKATPLIRVKMKDLAESGVEHVARVVGVQDGRPLLEDGRVLDVANVIWCTGFRMDFGWIRASIFDDDGTPLHNRGVTQQDGLYFLGLPFQFAAVSDTLPGISRDAKHIAKHIASHATSSAAMTNAREVA